MESAAENSVVEVWEAKVTVSAGLEVDILAMVVGMAAAMEGLVGLRAVVRVESVFV